ncbi:hypothetical protein FNV43_RR04810 [Rhamnella rubrinervis]|uniref:WIYLD domain-containing protein n=1 Tax=Rhamnella rubrinervis TaxID=2594499 RepID=A0A8K0HMP7_9ROSA|nr:hypothetical protein FNV43_RR04810 [Rhamnella rubrinervis]
MAPGGRRRKRGQTRMDAALDAMRPYGFSEVSVRQAVKELLNVYGGVDGWVFVEDAAYMLLIETLLEKQNVCEIQQHNSSQDPASDADEINGSIGESSSRALLHACSNPEVVDSGPQTRKVLDSASRTESLNISSMTTDSDGKDCFTTSGNTFGCEYSEKTQVQTPQHADKSSIQEEYIRPTQRRRFCHGWIESEDDEDLVELSPEPLPDELTKMLNRIQESQDKVVGC